MADKTKTTNRRGHDVLRDPLLNKGSAFTVEERDALALVGLLPPGYNTLDQQADRAFQILAAIDEPLVKYRELSSLQDRNEHLFFRILMDHLKDLMPIVYTPTVGLATQKFSEVFQRSRGVWITPADRGRIKSVLEMGAEGKDIKLTVVTDNESILGIGDQGAGGMAISIGKLALYTAGAGIHPANTLPVSLDVGTNNESLLENESYLGWTSTRMTGSAYDDLVEEFVSAFHELFPGALIQWEDFRKDNALNILDRYKDRVLSFNDDIQGTGAVTLAGILSALRKKGEPLTEQRIVILGAGAAGLGIARQIGAALQLEGVNELHRHIGVLDSGGLLVADREFRDAYKAELAWPTQSAQELGLDGGASLEAVIEKFKPSVLVGTSGQTGAFTQSLIETMASNVAEPVIMPLSNPTAKAEGRPADIIAWTDGRACIATGSPFDPVSHNGREIHIGQGNNVFIFPALGLGALLSQATKVTDGMITRTAQVLAQQVSAEELESGLLYPNVDRLREVTVASATAVYEQAYEDGVASAERVADAAALVRDSMWWPDYPTYV